MCIFYSNISIETLDGGMLFFSRWCQIQGLVYSSSNKRYEGCSLGDSCNSLFDAKLVQRLNFKERFAHKISTVSLYFLFTTQLSQGSTPLTLDRPSSGYPSLSSSTYSKRTAAAAINLQYISCMFDARAR